MLLFLVGLIYATSFIKIYDLKSYIHELTKTQCFFYFIKHVHSNRGHILSSQLMKRCQYSLLFFQKRFYISFVQQNQLISNSQTNCPVPHVPYNSLLVCIFLQSPEEGNSE